MGQQYFLFEVSEFVLFMLFSILYLIFTYKDQQKCANLFIGILCFGAFSNFTSSIFLHCKICNAQ